MRSAAVAPVVILLLLNGFTFDLVQGWAQCTNGDTCAINDDSLRFFVLGDIGGLPVWPYKSWAQATVAKSLAKMGAEKRTHFQLELGDNIYFNGVDNVNDERFQKTFEEVYKGQAMNKPWYIIAGNHDHFGNISAQVAYTQVSERWVFPALYYTVNYRLDPQTTVDFIMIDTIVLCGNTKDVSNAGFVEVLFAGSHEPITPKDPALAEMQWAWIERQLQQSTADYVFVAGHYPVYSIAEHGPTACLVDRLRPLLHKYKVTAYLSGHDHALQHFSMTEDGATVEYVVSGAASRTDISTKNEDKIPPGSLRYNYPRSSWWNPFSQFGFSSGAFIYAELSSSTAVFNFFDGKGELQYSFNAPPRIKLPPIH